MADTRQPAEETLLVCVGPDASALGLLAFANAMATQRDARWFAAHVEQPSTAMRSDEERGRIADILREAERLGGQPVTLTGRNVAEAIVAFARHHHVTRLIAGKPRRASWRRLLSRSPVDRLVRISGDMDVYVTTGAPDARLDLRHETRPTSVRLADYGAGIMYLFLATFVCAVLYPHLQLSNLIMVYLLGVMLTATGCGRGPAILVSLLSVLTFDFLFVPPRFSFSVDEAQYIVTFVTMSLVALVISHLAAGMREQAAIARAQQRQTAAMHGLSRHLASTRGVDQIAEVAMTHISESFDCDVLVLLPDAKRKLSVVAGEPSTVIQRDVVHEMDVARSVHASGRMAGWGTQGSPTSEILYVPLQAADSTFGVLALRPRHPKRLLTRELVALLESMARQVALALDVELITARRSWGT